MAFAVPSTTRIDFDDHVSQLESKWREERMPKFVFVAYELRGKKIHQITVTTPGVFPQLRSWRNFMLTPLFSHRVEIDDKGRNKNMYWNDLELSICDYNLSSALQNLMWLLNADPHSMMPRHRREKTAAQPHPFHESLMSDYVEERTDEIDEQAAAALVGKLVMA